MYDCPTFKLEKMRSEFCGLEIWSDFLTQDPYGPSFVNHMMSELLNKLMGSEFSLVMLSEFCVRLKCPSSSHV
ncbi:hypothetical protein HanXRQr2_Chr04g0163801 [Helianthus annuus]|uniref:Uncharacterized protein n=1 Tax=Helianthus annuus TaxID=4232 RepID=A0A9K3NS68_HELAN|nr:hypothetical protein HanXRQr2_Chr04g0163801 [Helianthus annuus]